MKLSKLVVSVAFSTLAFAAHANLVQNGSFEADSQGLISWNIYPVLAGGWSSDNLGIELRNNVAGAAQEGNNYVELDTTANSWMSQTLTITTSGLYELSFWYSPRPNVAAGSNGLSYSFGDFTSPVFNQVAGNSNGSNNWQNFTDTFQLAVGTTVLRFKAEGVSDSFGGSLDNISVTAVPEPESYALMLAGLGLMATIARRRKNRN